MPKVITKLELKISHKQGGRGRNWRNSYLHIKMKSHWHYCQIGINTRDWEIWERYTLIKTQILKIDIEQRRRNPNTQHEGEILTTEKESASADYIYLVRGKL